MTQDLIRKYAKESGVPEIDVVDHVASITANLLKEGMNPNDVKMNQYIILRLKKRLGLKESNVIKSFKLFFEPKMKGKTNG